jgi:hypothetical protein
MPLLRLLMRFSVAAARGFGLGQMKPQGLEIDLHIANPEAKAAKGLIDANQQLLQLTALKVETALIERRLAAELERPEGLPPDEMARSELAEEGKVEGRNE